MQQQQKKGVVLGSSLRRLVGLFCFGWLFWDTSSTTGVRRSLGAMPPPPLPAGTIATTSDDSRAIQLQGLLSRTTTKRRWW